MKVVPIESPSGLIRKPADKRQSVENAELRIALEQAVDAADLNLTERLAINKQFFPNGDGFRLVPQNADTIEITTYYKKDETELDDFAAEAMQIAAESGNEMVYETVKPSKKGNFQTNLESALSKLYSVFQNTK